MRIAHLSAEVSPFAKTGGLGDVVGALPIAQAELGHEVSVWMPLYRQVRDELRKRRITPEWVTDPLRIELGFETHEVGLLRTVLPGSDVPLYLIGNDRFFDRPHLYHSDIHGKDDGLRRYALFVRAVLEAMRRLSLVPNILNAHDWHTALAPMALAWDRPRDWHFERTATALTIHNAAYQGIYPPGEYGWLGLPREMIAASMWRGTINLLKAAILTSDAITAVSPTFAREIATPEGGFGLHSMIQHRASDVWGILNGIDTKVWNPAVDKKIWQPYDRAHLADKEANRRELLRIAGMEPSYPGMVVGIVGRLTEQKGYDLLFPVLQDLLDDRIRFVLLGSGEGALEAQVRTWSERAKGRFWGYVGFDDTLAHRIEAGADVFLMPSRFEPCGLSQLYSLAYGTPPIVRRVGGLADTVIGYEGWNAERATGFTFDAATPYALRDTVTWANRCFADKELWRRIVLNGMQQDFSWERSAEGYLDVYRRILQRKAGAMTHSQPSP